MHLVRWLMASPLKGASKLYVGGDNTWGQLGDNTVLARSSPVLVSSNYWQSFALGTSHAVAIRNDGALFGWGNNDFGQVGDGFIYTNKSSPVQIGTSSWTSVAASDANSYAIRKDGALFAWGSNAAGQIGNNAVSVTTNYSWTQIHPGLRDMYGAALNFDYLLAIRSDNKLLTNSTDLIKSNFEYAAQAYDVNPLFSSIERTIPVAGYGNENYNQAYISSGIYSQDSFGIGKRLASANNYALIKTDGSLFISGPNYFGELGNNTTVNSFSPVQIGTSSWSQICIEPGFAAAIRSDGALFTWGNNIYGQLGLGLYPGNDNRSSPVQVGTSSWSQVAINRKISNYLTTTVAAIRSDGALFMWGAPGQGDNFTPEYTGILGNNGATQNISTSFTAIGSNSFLDNTGNGYILRFGLAGDGTIGSLQLYGYDFLQKFSGSWTQIELNYAIKTDGTLYNWYAANGFNGTTGARLTGIGINENNYPQQVGNSSWSFISIGPNLQAAFGIRTDGALFAWGGNSDGQLGDGTTISKSSPVQIGTSSWISVATNGVYTLAIRADGALFAWGFNNSGQIGDNTIVNKSSPVQIGSSSWVAIGTRGRPGVTIVNGYAIRTDGSLFGWGNNAFATVGDGTTISRSSPVQIGTSSWTFIPNHSYQSAYYAIRKDGALFSWGDAGGGVLGDGTTVNKSSPVQIGTSSWIQVRGLNDYVVFGTLVNGSLYRWGAAPTTLFAPGTVSRSSPVQIGNTDTRFNSPVQIGTSSWSQVTLNTWYAHAIRSDGALFAWGKNIIGALGDGTTVNKSSPVQIGTSSWSQVWNTTGGWSHAIRSDKALFAWGTNSSGQLGDNTVVSKSSPVQVGNSSWTQVKSRTNTFALRSDGALFAWGTIGIPESAILVARSSPVQINTAFQASSPVQIGTSSWSLVTAGKSYASAIRSDRALFAWGVNTNYNLGDGTSINRSSPVQIGTSSWTLVNAGTSFTVGIASNSVLYGWGNNDNFATGVSDLVNPIMGAGFSHGAIVSRKGRLYTWGLNNFGQLGDGTTVNKSSPIQIGASSWSIVSGGLEHTLALNNVGQLYAWGRNDLGQLGDNTSVNRSSPVQIGTSSWAQIKAGISHSMAVRIDGALFTWGSNSFGQLGRNLDTLPLNVSSPVQVGTSSWTFATTNRETAYAIRSDGALFGWGKNDVGQIGNNAVNISGVMSWTQVAVGVSFGAGIRSDGGLFTWGVNNIGQLGDSTTINKSSPVQIGTSSWTQVSIESGTSGNLYTAAIRVDGGLFTWGSNVGGRLGSGTTVNRSSPVQVGTSSWSQVAINDQTTAAIRADGGLFTWGTGGNGTLGDSTTVSRSSPVQIGTSSWTQIAAGLYHFSAIRADGGLFTWGYNQFGQLGTGIFPYTDQSSLVQVGTSSWTQISSGYGHSLAIRSDGALFAWGRATVGQLGTNTTIYGGSERVFSWTQASIGTFGGAGIRNDGALIVWSQRGYLYGKNNGNQQAYSLLDQLDTSSWTQVSMGQENVFAIRSDGALFAWGRNTGLYSGMLGDNTTIPRSSPVQIGTSSWIKVSSGAYTVKAIRSDGALFSWGRFDSFLGDNTTINRSSPVQIGTSSWTQIYNADAYNLAIRSDGALFYWGVGGFSSGRGISETGADIYSWTQVKAGLNFTVALNSLGQLWTWGQNSNGQLGLGTTTNTSGPAQVGTSSWTQIAAGHSAAAAIRSDGRLFVWGGNQYGVIGDVTTVNKSSPVAIGTSSWSQVSIGLDTIAGIRSNGNVFVWGRNSAGQIGDNTVVNKSSPVLIGTSSWTQVTVGWDAGLSVDRVHAIRSDGALFAWGSNAYGTLGDNTTVNKSSPVQVGSSSWTLVRAANGYVGAIRSDGGLFTWGVNEVGQLGNGQTETLSSPVQIGTSSWTQLTLGAGNFAIRSDGALFAWGWYRHRNNYATDMLGTGNTAYIDRRESWTAVAHDVACIGGIRNDGTLFVWGAGSSNAIYNPANSPAVYQPSQSTKVGNSSWTQVVQGRNSFLALRTDGALFAWGGNFNGQLGDGTTVDRSSPVQIGTSSWTQISIRDNDNPADPMHSAAIRKDGALFTWGAGRNGKLGDGTIISKSSPVQIGTSSWIQVAAGSETTVAIRSDGALFTWGLNSLGRLGDGTTVNKSSPVQIGTSSWSFAQTGGIAIRTDGALFAWGDNAYGTIGDNTTVNKSSPVQIGTSSWSFVSSKEVWRQTDTRFTTYAIRSDGAMFGWGSNGSVYELGTVGDGTTIDRSSPVQIGIGNSWSFVRRGAEGVGALAITTTGLVYVWGRAINSTAQAWQFTDTNLISTSGPSVYTGLPNSSTPDLNIPYVPTAVQYYPFLRSPVQVGTDSWIQVSSFYTKESLATTDSNGVFGIRNNNKMYAWGTNTTTAPLGDNTTIPRSSPVQIGFGSIYLTPIQISTSSWTQIAADGNGTCAAISSNSRLYTWGNNASGQVGDGTVISQYNIQERGVYSWSQISTGLNRYFYDFAGVAFAAIRSDGALFTWGDNSNNLLGNNTAGFGTAKSSPVQIGTSSWVQVSIGTYNALAVRYGDYTVWGWGLGGYVGDNTTISRSSPVQISNNNFKAEKVHCGLATFIIEKWTNTLRGWGYNLAGQVGDGTTVTKSSPVLIGTSKWSQITSNYFQTIGIREDGGLFTWGSPEYGQLADNSTAYRSSPVQVGTSSWTQVVGSPWAHALAIRSDGALFTWGSYTFGQGGRNEDFFNGGAQNISKSWSIVNVSELNVSAGIQPDGSLYIWGRGSYGEYLNILPSGITTAISPVQIGTSSWSQVATGYGQGVLAIRTDGALFAWGGNSSGELGDGTTVNKSSPVQIGTSSWTQVAMSRNYAFAIRKDGALFSWGTANTGVLGTSTAINRSSPVQIGTSSWSQVKVSSDYHVIALRTDGALFTWGYNFFGQLGDGTTINRSSPVQVGTSSWTQIGIDYYSAYAIRSGGSLFSWGNNSQGRLGDNTVNNRSSPVQIGTSSWTQVGPSIAIRTDGALFALGGYGVVAGLNDTALRSSPVQVGTSSWSIIPSIIGGTQGIRAAIRLDNALFTWGGFDSVGIGNPDISQYSYQQGLMGTADTGSSSPVQVGVIATYNSPVQIGTSSWTQIAATIYTSSAIRSDGAIFTWGRNYYGQLGDNTTVNRSSPIQIGSGSWVQVSGNFNSFFALAKDNTVYAWGNGGNNAFSGGNLGDSTTTNKSSPVQLGYYGSWISVAAGESDSLRAVRSDGALFAWGYNFYGQIGDGTQISRSSPVQIGSSSWTQVVKDGGSTAGYIRQDGLFYITGYSIPDNLYISRSSPVLVGPVVSLSSPVQIGTSSWIQVGVVPNYDQSRGDFYESSYARRLGGSLFAWGQNTYGQLGDGTTINKSSPVQIGTSSWTQVRGSAGILSNGTLYVWGLGTSGQIGDNTAVSKSSPVQLGSYPLAKSPIQIGTSSWTTISAGGTHAVAIRSNGSLFGWGLATSGQVGDGTLVSKSSPVQIGSSSWTAITAGNLTSYGITSAKLLFAWGGGANGTFGDGTTTNKPSPVQISAAAWNDVSSDDTTAYATRSDGRLFAWGVNANGQIGTLTTANTSSPVQVGTFFGVPTLVDSGSWSFVSAGYDNSIGIDSNKKAYIWGNDRTSAYTWTYLVYGAAIRSDGALFRWGNNANGQLGDGTTVNKSSPVQIGTSSWTQVRPSLANGSTFAIRSDGALFAWGDNASGQLGLNSSTPSESSMVQIGTSSWTQIAFAPGTANTPILATRADGALFAWALPGSPITPTNYPFSTFLSSPVQISSLSGVSWTQVYAAAEAALFAGAYWFALTQSTGKKYLFNNVYRSYRFPGDEYPNLVPAEFTDIVSYSSPVQIGVGGTWIKGSAGAGQNYLINNANVLYSWGSRLLSAGVIQTDSTITPVVADIDSAVANKAFNVTRGYVEK